MKGEIEFWDSRYVAGRTPWDFGGVPAALSQWLAAQPSAERVLVPGCGSGYELKAFQNAEWDVVAIDFSPAAVARAQENVGSDAAKIILGDFFAYDFAGEMFDVIYERTFLCSMPPERWPTYVRRMRELLGPGGNIIGFFFFGEQRDPPPYPLTPAKQKALFADSFALQTDEAVSDSMPLFAGRERWQIWQKQS